MASEATAKGHTPYRNDRAANICITPEGRCTRRYGHRPSQTAVNEKWIKLNAEAAKGPVPTPHRSDGGDIPVLLARLDREAAPGAADLRLLRGRSPPPHVRLSETCQYCA